MTAVEWYEKEIDSLFEKYVDEEISIRDFFTMKRNLFYKALEMEKQQIIDAYQKGFIREFGNRDEDVIKYYSETYKK